QISGYIVAEPFNALAEILKVGKIWRFTGDVWKNHACCVVTMHENDLQQRPEWSQKVVSAIVQAQSWIIDHHREDAARMLAKDNPAQYTPHAYATLARVLAPGPEQAVEYAKSRAIRHPDWNEHRIDFQPYPFPSYTEKLVEMLKTTYVSGRNDFLPGLDPKFVAGDLVDDRLVKKAILDQGARSKFGLPESFTRGEIVEV
ncbi:MAG: ABC transporter substrate-binding protein, partial [Pusillimonas sp.]